MNYQEARQYLLSLKNIPRREYLLDHRPGPHFLERLRYFLACLGNPEKKIPHYIHVTGTSGKGSTTLMLAAILQAAGKRVGAMTSPSPDGLFGRSEINGRPMRRKEFAILMGKIKIALEIYSKHSPYDLPSEFELLTALSLLYFAEKKVPWVVVEVGLGGRFDSTNVIPRKDVAIITNIGRDHVELIGPTLQNITSEKAGIITNGAAVFTSVKQKNLQAILDKECRKHKTRLRLIHNRAKIINQNLSGLTFKYQDVAYTLPVLGEHQIANALLAIEAARYLRVATEAIQRGLRLVRLPTRSEIVNKKPLIILDGAHNPDKMRATINTIKKIGRAKDLQLLIGFAANKNWHAMLKQLATLQPQNVACTRFTENIFRSVAAPAELARATKKLLPQATVEQFLDPREALIWIKKKQKTSDVLLITGSMYLSGELRKLFSAAK